MALLFAWERDPAGAWWPGFTGGAEKLSRREKPRAPTRGG